MLAKTRDEQTQELFDLVRKQKAEIASAERPDWKTNCNYTDGGKTISIHVVTSVPALVSLAATLLRIDADYTDAAKKLGVTVEPPTPGGYPVADWLSDIKTRLVKLTITQKRSRLETLESRLSAIVSPELKATMELAAIAKELS